MNLTLTDLYPVLDRYLKEQGGTVGRANLTKRLGAFLGAQDTNYKVLESMLELLAKIDFQKACTVEEYGASRTIRLDLNELPFGWRAEDICFFFKIDVIVSQTTEIHHINNYKGTGQNDVNSSKTCYTYTIMA